MKHVISFPYLDLSTLIAAFFFFFRNIMLSISHCYCSLLLLLLAQNKMKVRE